jgi:hypothetical protein
MADQLTFLLGKDPQTSHGGDMTMFRTLRTIAEERFIVEIICLSDEPDVQEAGAVRVAKPLVSPARLLMGSAVGRRSLVHTRFDIDGVRAAVEQSSADRFVAIHSYMAEPYLRARDAAPSRELLVSTEVPESAVWRRTRGPVGRFEARRLQRDELRIARVARAIAGYDRDEVEAYRARGIGSAHWLPVTIAPAERIDVAATPPRLVVLGNRTWAPNALAARTMVEWWPEISAGIPDAELILVGPPAGDVPAAPLPAGVIDLGFVEDVGEVLSGCRGLAAPISVGGGVRVKMLEAASRGLPVASTVAGLGSIERSLGMIPAVDRADFVRQCRALLLDADAAAAAGTRLHNANAERWSARTGQDAVHAWLSA